MSAAEAKARLLAWGEASDARRAKMLSGWLPLLASGAVGAVVAGFAAGAGKRAAPARGGVVGAATGAATGVLRSLLSVRNLIRIGTWAMPLVVSAVSKSSRSGPRR